MSRSTAGLKSSKFDCDLAIRHNPLLNFSSSSSSYNSSDLSEFDKGEGAKQAYNFEVNLKSGLNDSRQKVSKKPVREDKKEGVGVKKLEEREILLRKCKESIPNITRELTGYVGTRWYRSPEIILLEKIYSSAIDMWSVGCIFSELLGMVKENVSNYKKRSALFPGTSCFPLSPSNNPTMEIAGFPISPRDQLKLIIETKGTPGADDVSFLSDKKASDYVKNLPKSKGVKLKEIFSKEEETAISLLEKMLSFNPYFRITAKEALRHKYFAEVRNKELEYEEGQEIELIADKYEKRNDIEYLANLVLTKILSRR
jgi:serine/threonine protein kinase